MASHDSVWIETSSHDTGFIAWIVSRHGRHGFGLGATRDDAVADASRCLRGPLPVRHLDLQAPA
jgi:hypothetical protein